MIGEFMGKYKYKYRYTSPFGEEWAVYRMFLGFIPVAVEHVTHLSFYNSEIDEYMIKNGYV